MEYFNSYFDKVKASEQLKEKAKTFLQDSLAETQKSKVKTNKQIKMIFASACAFTVILFSAIGGYAYYNTPVNYVSLDINPSVELGLNAFDTVVSVEASNDDGESLIEEENVINLPVEDAIDSLVQEATDQGFVKEDGSTVVAVTAESKDDEKALELQEKSSNGVSLAMSNKSTIAAVYADCSDLSLRTEAKDMGISPGKYKLIKMLQTLDPTITVEQYKDAKVSEIISKANELLQNSDILVNQNENTQKALDKMQSAAKDMNENQVKASEKKQSQETEQNQNKENNSNNDSNSNNKNESMQQSKKQDKSTSISQSSTSSALKQDASSAQQSDTNNSEQESTGSNRKQNSNAINNSAKLN